MNQETMKMHTSDTQATYPPKTSKTADIEVQALASFSTLYLHHFSKKESQKMRVKAQNNFSVLTQN